MNIKIRTLLAFILCACLLVLLGPMAAAHAAETNMRALQSNGTVKYVTPGGTGDCTGWTAACDLQTALTTAGTGDEIWAAAGAYKPAADPAAADPRTATFQLKAGVAIYGGFAGMETSRDERDWHTNLTVLSGDIENNDSQTPIITDLSTVTGNGTNSYHVVTGATGAILDGVTITGGTAKGTIGTVHANGGGMYNDSSSPALTNVTFTGNEARNGGGMYNDSSSPTLTNVTFSKNAAGSDGGGMYNINNSSPVLTGVAFNGDRATQGGGMSNRLSSSPTLTGVTFTGNEARYGGGMYNSASSPQLTDVTFSGNNFTDSQVGGGMYNYSSSPTLTNVTFNGNWAPTGGGMYNARSSSTLTNVTFSGNSASSGGGIYNGYLGSPVIRNTILWGNTGGEVVGSVSTSPPIITASVVQGGCPAYATCTNVIDTNPLLGALGDYGGATQTIPLLPGSSAVDAGDNTLCPATDQRGVARPQGARCDIGAFEQNYYYVMQGGTGNCMSWTTACDLHTALTTAGTGSEIWAAAGVYKPSADPTDRGATFQLKAGVAIYGGFAGTESSRDERNPAVNVTILSGDVDNNDSQTPIITDLSTVTGNGTNSYHVVTGATGAILDGVTITAGNANEAYNSDKDRGGGMVNDSSSPTLSNVTFSGNSAWFWGGGMYNYSSSPTLTNTTFSNNVATESGGGMYNYYNSSPTLTNVTLSLNRAGMGGGMHNLYDSNPTLTNVTLSLNRAGMGGGMYNDWSSPTLNNVTFSGNSADTGGGMYNYGNSSPLLQNTILWGDTGGEVVNDYSSSTITASVVQGGCPAGATCTNVINSDPLLGALGDHGGATQTIPLLPGSSAIDAGDDTLCPATDQRGVARPQDGDGNGTTRCDFGAYERVFFSVDPGGPYLGAINTLIPFDGSAFSNVEGEPLTYTWDFGDGTTGSGAQISHSYAATGIYKVCLTVNNGQVDSDPACTLAVIYDPSTGFVTGGGWIDSPAGAYVPDPSLAGKATFGFVSKYSRGATVPTGTTQFQFDVAGFSFYSDTYEWLVVSKDQATAQFKGSGMVSGTLDPNGKPYKFMLWAGDGTPDTFRIKVWDKATETVIYDNQLGTSDDAELTTALGGGSIVVHKAK